MTRTRALVLLIAATVVWGGTFTVVKQALADSGPMSFLALRFLVAAPVTLLLVRGRGLASARSPRIVLCGVALACGYAFQTWGLATTTPARSAFITALSVVLVPLLEPTLGVAPWAWRSGGGALLAFGGLAVILRPEGQSISPGDLLTLGCAVAFAFHGVLLQAAVRFAQPAAVNAVQVVTTAIIAIPAGLVEGWRVTLTPRLASAVGITGVLSTVVAFWAMAAAQRSLSAAQTGVVLAFEPVVASAISVALGQDTVSARLLLGGLLVVAGILGACRSNGVGRA